METKTRKRIYDTILPCDTIRFPTLRLGTQTDVLIARIEIVAWCSVQRTQYRYTSPLALA